MFGVYLSLHFPLLSEDCPDATVFRGYGKCLPINKVLSLPCYLEVRGGLQNTEGLTFPILRKTKRQAVHRVQYPSVPSLCGEKNQSPKANNPAVMDLRLLNDVISLPVYADLLAT